MPSWLKKIVSLGRRPKGSTSVTKQDQSSSRSDFKSTAPSKGSCSNGQKSTPESQPDERVGERKRTQPQEKLPRNTTKNSEEQPRDSDNMTAAATTAVSSTQKTSTSVSDHIHLSQRTGDLIQTSAHNGVGDIENSGSALNPNQIVFVLKSGNGGYRIYSLIEGEPCFAAAAAAKSSDESASEDGEKIKKAKVINGKAGDDHRKTKKLSPFKLSVTYAQSLPEEFTREFLVEKAPEHLAGVDELHVIVSTRSGLGLAAGFYEGVLKPLLEEGFGFEAVGDVVEGDDDDDKEGRKTRSGKTYQITFTKSADTVKDFARGLVSPSSSFAQGRQQRQPSRTIILLSGDGGIIDLLNGLDHHPLDVSSSPSPSSTPTLAILPLGTGNALFHSLHKPLYKPQSTDGPSPLVLGLRTLFKRGVSAPLPTFRAEFSPGAKLISGQPEVLPNSNDSPKDNLLFDVTSTSSGTTPKKRPEITHLLGAIVFSYGFHASLVYESDTPAYRVHGDKRFGMAAGELLKLSHLYDADVFIRRSSSSSSSSERREEIITLLPKDSHSTYILLTLVSNLEKTFCISPASRPLDGQLRLVHFGFDEEGAGGADAEAGNRGKQTMDIMMAAYRDGAHINDPEEKFKDVVGYEEVEEIKVVINETDERWRKVCVDGTIVEVEKGGWVTVKREGGIGSGKGEKERERLRVLVDKEVVVGRW
ncbi:ATP-NAD kinase-like domain-containing protein [Neurospora hispaniola]|uniref:ATP-NAD kinase-like domain-containing protein n=1 Tax=Neurospora hispaniola TaxID=588809 RepID=A0AAJ0I2E6_9PEZI|nr:ATP-NAD kinase-like domain-containing protein [Neurospora hispaniola]